MAAPSNDIVAGKFWKLTESRLQKIEWDIRVGDNQNKVIAIRANDYHPKVLELSIDDISELIEPLGYRLINIEKDP